MGYSMAVKDKYAKNHQNAKGFVLFYTLCIFINPSIGSLHDLFNLIYTSGCFLITAFEKMKGQLQLQRYGLYIYYKLDSR